MLDTVDIAGEMCQRNNRAQANALGIESYNLVVERDDEGGVVSG